MNTRLFFPLLLITSLAWANGPENEVTPSATLQRTGLAHLTNNDPVEQNNRSLALYTAGVVAAPIAAYYVLTNEDLSSGKKVVCCASLLSITTYAHRRATVHETSNQLTDVSRALRTPTQQATQAMFGFGLYSWLRGGVTIEPQTILDYLMNN